MWNENVTAPAAFSSVQPGDLIQYSETYFDSNGNVYTAIRLINISNDITIPTLVYNAGGNNDTNVYNADGASSGWMNTAYRTITFTTPFLRSTNPDFYDWFIQNAVKQ